LTDDARILRIDRGSLHGVVAGMTVSVSFLSEGGHAEVYTFQGRDIEGSYSCIRLGQPGIGPFEVSFIVTEGLNHGEEVLAKVINMIESTIPGPNLF
jgi:hypothetical protein